MGHQTYDPDYNKNMQGDPYPDISLMSDWEKDSVISG